MTIAAWLLAGVGHLAVDLDRHIDHRSALRVGCPDRAALLASWRRWQEWAGMQDRDA
jgi:hypothetical protein